ncbi:MAG: hypothetical protein ACR2P8_14695 [Myxococcota bacterium]
MKIDWLVLVRDMLIVLTLGSLGTVAVTFALGGLTPYVQLGVAFLMIAIGFAISGWLKGAGRFKHLSLVAVGVWLVALLDTWLRAPERYPPIGAGLVIIVLAMLVGGAASLAFRRSPAAATPPSAD